MTSDSPVLGTPHLKLLTEKTNQEAHYFKSQLHRFLKYFKDIQARLIQLESYATTNSCFSSHTPSQVHHQSTQTSHHPYHQDHDKLSELKVSYEHVLHENEVLSKTIRDMRVAMESCVLEYQEKLKSKEQTLQQLQKCPDSTTPAYKQLHQRWIETNAHLLQVMQDRDLLIEKSNQLRAQVGQTPNSISIGVQTDLNSHSSKLKKEKKKTETLTKIDLSNVGLELRKKGIRNWNEIIDNI
ncbi:hypothetical protein HMI54_009378 [Coelomomyces lativittatus]|nr:hypothetical protein HMI54_009378 [Coelomomyces lativittatus]KAJ1511189.1 hypothetical protein HMI56_005701 [Coelomomyces lativittatus]